MLGERRQRISTRFETQPTRDEIGVITAEVTKQRDGPTGYKFAYSLRQIELGRDQDGDPVTTCLVESMDVDKTDSVQVNGPALIALNALNELLDEQGEVLRDPRYPGTPCVGHRDWLEICILGGQLSNSKKRETHRRVFNREVEVLKSKGLVSVRDNLVWRLNKSH